MLLFDAVSVCPRHVRHVHSKHLFEPSAGSDQVVDLILQGADGSAQRIRYILFPRQLILHPIELLPDPLDVLVLFFDDLPETLYRVAVFFQVDLALIGSVGLRR